VAVLPVLIDQHFEHGARGAIVQIGPGAPEFDQGGRVEDGVGSIVRAARAHVVGLQVGKEPGGVAHGATDLAVFEDLLPALRRLRKLALLQVGAGRRLE
jgi:hypothetical protein